MNEISDSGEKGGNISKNNDHPEGFESIPDTSGGIVIGNIDVSGDYNDTDEILTSAEKREVKDAVDEVKYGLNRMDLIGNVETGDTLFAHFDDEDAEYYKTFIEEVKSADCNLLVEEERRGIIDWLRSFH
jgi:hypothetical protein